jgi:hypothetical protein
MIPSISAARGPFPPPVVAGPEPSAIGDPFMVFLIVLTVGIWLLFGWFAFGGLVMPKRGKRSPRLPIKCDRCETLLCKTYHRRNDLRLCEECTDRYDAGDAEDYSDLAPDAIIDLPPEDPPPIDMAERERRIRAMRMVCPAVAERIMRYNLAGPSK